MSGAVSDTLAARSTLAAELPFAAEGASATPAADPQAHAGSSSREERRALAAEIGRRALYWSPVFVLMVLFGEIAFLGLRPALAEQRRLDVAEKLVAERLSVAQEKRAEVELQLAARRDPVYQERLRRLRIHPPAGH